MDPLNPQQPQPKPSVMPGAPLQSQGMNPGAQPEAPGQEFISPEERQQLQELLDATKEKMGELQTAKFASGNAREAAKLDALKEVFQMMREAGVDLSSQESVADFIDRMKAANPTMAADFEAALDALIGVEPEPAPTQGMPVTDPNKPPQSAGPAVPPMSPTASPTPNANPNEALSQGLRGPVPPTQGS